MVMSWFGGKADVGTLIAQKKYAKAIEVLKEQLAGQVGDVRVRQQLADVLILSGHESEAVPVLLAAADELASQGQAAKAIALLKKVQKIDPTRGDVAGRIASLIKDKGKRAAGWNPTGGPAAAGYEPVSWGQVYTAAQLEASATAPPPPPPAVDPRARIEAARNATWIPSTRQDDEAAADASAPPPVPPPAIAAVVPPPPVVSAAEPSEPAIEVVPEVDEVPPEVVRGQILSAITTALRMPPPPPAPGPARPEAEEVKDSPLFSGFSEEELVAVIGGLRLLSFEPGDIVITEGDPGDSVFVLTEGRVKAFVRSPEGRGQVQVRQLGEGDFFGEISILSGKPRTATVTAATYCELLELDRPTLDQITRDYPKVRQVLEDFYIERASTQEDQMRRAMEARGQA